MTTTSLLGNNTPSMQSDEGGAHSFPRLHYLSAVNLWILKHHNTRIKWIRPCQATNLDTTAAISAEQRKHTYRMD